MTNSIILGDLHHLTEQVNQSILDLPNSLMFSPVHNSLVKSSLNLTSATLKLSELIEGEQNG